MARATDSPPDDGYDGHVTTGEIVITAYITLLTAGLGSLFWRQLEGLRHEMAELRREVYGEITGLRRDVDGEITGLRSEIAELRRELHDEIAGVRSEIAGLRSDLTQVALAVGARRPRASEG